MAKVRWHARNRCWIANVGEKDKRGKRKPVYAPFAGLPGTEDGRRQAQKIADGLDDRIKYVPVAALLVEDLVNQYLESTEKQSRPRTVQKHKVLLQLFCDFRPNPKVPPYGLWLATQIKASDLEVMTQAWADHGYSAAYIGNLVSSVRNVWNWAARPISTRKPEQLLPAAVMAAVRRPTIRAKPVKYTDRTELARFLRFVWREINHVNLTYPNSRCSSCYDARLPGPCKRGHQETIRTYRETLLLVRAAIHTGCRPGEIRELEWSEINWEQSAAVQYKGKKWLATGNPRIIIFPKIILRALRRHYDSGHRHEQWCFTHIVRTTKKPGRVKGVREPWADGDLSNRIRTWRMRAYQAKAIKHLEGPDRLHLYGLRHASISEALKSGVPTAMIAELHGTSERMVNEVYGHIRLDSLKQAAEQIEKAKRGKVQ